MTISVLSTTVVLGEWGGGRQAKVGENARPWLQHMGALRPDLPIEARVKIKMVSAEAEVIRLGILRFTPTQTSDLERRTMNSISEAHLRSAKFHAS